MLSSGFKSVLLKSIGILLLKGSLVTSVLSYPEIFFHAVTFMKGPLTVKCLTVTSHEINFFFLYFTGKFQLL